MKDRLLNAWDTLRTSYWFVPSVLAAGAMVLSLVLPLLDARIQASGLRLPAWIVTTTHTARATLSALAGAMFAVIGTVFSITVVTLSLASQQFGPRLLRRFMYDLITQITLGLFLASGFFCLLVLRVVEDGDHGLAAPHISVLSAVLFVVVSMLMLIAFIHHVATLIQAPHIVAAVADDLDEAIIRLYPETLAKSRVDVGQAARSAEELTDLGEIQWVIRAKCEGYIQAIDTDRLPFIAGELGIVLRLRRRPGQFVVAESPLADVWFDGKSSPREFDVERLTQEVNDTIIVGNRRTPRQDVECAIEELVEVAVRSLSPGINDPFTAVQCIDRLGASLSRLAGRKMPSSFRYDAEGCLRVIADTTSFPDILDAAFNQIRQYGRDSAAVAIRLLETLQSIANFVHRNEDMQAIRTHAEMIFRLSETLQEEHDKREFRLRFDALESSSLSLFDRE